MDTFVQKVAETESHTNFNRVHTLYSQLANKVVIFLVQLLVASIHP